MSYSQDNELSGMPLGLLEQARHGLVTKLKVQNNAYQSAGGVGGGLVGTLAGGLAGLLARKGFRRFASPAGAVGGGLVGGSLGRAAGGLMGTSIPAAVDQPLTPDTIGAVSRFINKQANDIPSSLGVTIPVGMGAGGLIGAAASPDAPVSGTARGMVQGGAAGLGVDLGTRLGTALGDRIGHYTATIPIGAGLGGAAGLILARKLLGNPKPKPSEKAAAYLRSLRPH